MKATSLKFLILISSLFFIHSAIGSNDIPITGKAAAKQAVKSDDSATPSAEPSASPTDAPKKPKKAKKQGSPTNSDALESH